MKFNEYVIVALVTFPSFIKLAGREGHKTDSAALLLSFRFDKQLEFMVSCLLEVRFAEVLLEGTAVFLVLDTSTSAFNASAPGRLWGGTIEHPCNITKNDHTT